MTDEQTAEHLKGWARSAFPQSMNNSFAMSEWVRRILDLMRKVEPAEYAEVHAAVFCAPPPDMRPGDESLSRLSTLYRKLDEEGLHVQANTVSLAMDEIKRLMARPAPDLPTPAHPPGGQH